MGVYLADMHIHTRDSFDSSMKIEDIIKVQEKNGLKYMALTDHIEFSNQPVKEVVDRINRRNEEIDKLQETTNIKLIKGVEISEPHHFSSESEILKEKCDIDYILGSIHHLYGMPIKKMNHYHNAYNLYLKSMLDMITYADIDTVAHLDYLKRHINNGSFDESLIEEILRLIVAKNLALEINTSGYRRCHECFPNNKILDLYASIGGKKVTYGSDAHNLSELYDHIEDASIENTHYNFNQGVVIKRRFRKI